MPRCLVERLRALERTDLALGFETKEPYHTYFHQNALQDAADGRATVHVLVHTSFLRRALKPLGYGPRESVLGFFTLSATSMRKDTLPTAMRDEPYAVVPAALIGQLAVAHGVSGKGYGRRLVVEAFRTLLAESTIGWRLVVVDAAPGSDGFYTKLGFQKSQSSKSSTTKMYIPRATVESAVREAEAA